MEFLRIGEKLINPHRVHRAVEQILKLRSTGQSQQEVADQMGVDRTLVSRLESLGEVRKGSRLALVGFPVANKEEIEALARQEGVEFVFVMTDRERWQFAEHRSGVDLANELMVIFSELRDFDSVIFLGSDMRIKLVESILEPGMVLSIELGKSPMQEDVYVAPKMLQEAIRSLMG
ncbi:MAG: helix-turn-helix domain-containing protein [Firmicutes bacterium]|nr:helix-turn-helix domain-containing protein [Bacillota bacterium]